MWWLSQSELRVLLCRCSFPGLLSTVDKNVVVVVKTDEDGMGDETEWWWESVGEEEEEEVEKDGDVWAVVGLGCKAALMMAWMSLLSSPSSSSLTLFPSPVLLAESLACTLLVPDPWLCLLSFVSLVRAGDTPALVWDTAISATTIPAESVPAVGGVAIPECRASGSRSS